MASAAPQSIVNFSAVNWLRFGAFGIGVWYGMSRQYSLTRFVKARNEAEEKKHYDELVEEARVAYEAHINREEAEAAAKDGVVWDSESYKYHAEKYMNWALARSEAAAAAQKKEEEKKK
ncbi:hypothetical protein HK102_000623 [Quaeritorhiza haematococci]|nr:hypothetical protein HK102_000623 [Quaeritorhiza haematococci]